MGKEISRKNRIPEGLPCGQFVYSAEGDQNILYADNNVVRLFGCSNYKEFIDYVGNSFRNMVHPDDLEEAEKSINAQTLESGHRHDYLRYRIITKQGQVRYIEDFGHIVFDNNGHAYYYVFIVSVGQKEFFNEYYNSFAEGQIDAMNWKVDHLTGLKNIAAFREELENPAGSLRDEVCTVAVFDIIGLQDVNRNSGRGEGDSRIRALVQSVYKYMPKGCFVYRGYDAEIITVCQDMTEPDVIEKIKETVRSSRSKVFFGVSSTVGEFVNAGQSKKKGTILQALEEAQYDLNVKKMLNEESARSQALTSLVRALEEVDQDTEEHVTRTRNMGISLGKRLGLSDAQLTSLELLCLLHDIGKIAVPLEILNKPGKLTDAEWAVLRSHAEKGCQIAMASRELKPIAGYIKYHHERWDGKGYPSKLSGEDIPVLSRIISIVDAYDAMVNDRCYRKALSSEYAMKEIRDNAGTQFDPHMAEVFLKMLSESPELALGKKTGAGEVRVFKETTEHNTDSIHTDPVAYCEYRLDVDDRIIEAGPSFEAITGYSPDEILGKMTQFELIPPEDLEDYRAQVGNQFSKSDTAFLRHRIKRRDGKIINVICHGERKFDSATRSFKSTIQVYEVVNYEKDEEYKNRLKEAQKIRKLNQTITSLLDNMPGMTFTKDAKTGVYLACNQAFAQYAHKKNPDGVVGLTDAEIFDPVTAGHFVEDDRTALFMNEPYIFFEDVLDAAGHQRQFQTTKFKYTDAYGRLCLQGMCQDVTDMVRIQRENASTREAYEKVRDMNTIYAHLAHALARGYTDLFYVNMETDELIEFHTDDETGVLTEARRGTDFFEGCERDARLFVHEEDQKKFIEAMNRENLSAALEESNVFELTYRRIKGKRTFYVLMKVTRMEDDHRIIVISVSDIDELMKQRQAEEQIKEERVIYARLHALAGNFICIYVVDPETNHYREVSATEDYMKSFAQDKKGDDFFARVREEAERFNYPEDLSQFLLAFTKENILKEIDRSGSFNLHYRFIMKERPVYVQMKAAMVEEKEGLRLIVGLYDIDAQVRQEQEYGKRLEQAQTQASVDALTGVKNKHAFLETEVGIDRRIAENSQPPFSVVVFDVNNLKLINDTEGHQAGDQYIRDACKIICDIFKHSPVFRVGGDEFAVISQGKDHERIKELMGKMEDYNTEASHRGGIVIACGMSEFDHDACVAQVFERADHKMYENKSILKSSGDA